MSHATFSAPDMTAYCGLEELGLVAVGMRCQGGRVRPEVSCGSSCSAVSRVWAPGVFAGVAYPALSARTAGASAHDAGGVCGTLPLSRVFSFLV